MTESLARWRRFRQSGCLAQFSRWRRGPLRCRALAASGVLLCARAGHATEVTVGRTIHWYHAMLASQVLETPANPQNTVLGLPTLQLSGELRPDVRVLLDDLKLVARPVLGAETALVRQAGDYRPLRNDWHGYFNEVFGSLRASDWLEVTYGIQNYEWGAAQTLNPSNAIVTRPLIQNFLALIPGRSMARVNLSAGRSFSCVLLAETRAPDPAATSSEQPKALVKLEYSNPEAADYFGVVAGTARHGYSWLGEYGNLQLEEFSLYADARHTLGTDTWYPAEPPRIAFVQSQADTARIYSLAVFGARWAMNGGNDARVEFVYNDAGYDRDQEQAALRTLVAHKYDSAAVSHYFNAVRDARSKYYAFASLFIPDFGPSDSVSLMLRYLFSVPDQSSAAFVDAQWAASDSVELHLSLAAALGPASRQLTSAARTTGILGARLSW